MSSTGVAFSGGGIRSAALCSGVLRRLLQKGITPDYLSCVSGGGYTGTAYLDWKYRNEQKDDPKWHKEFFDHMCRRAGMVCNWQNPLEGFLDTIMILSLMIFVAIILPCFIWFGFAFPTAYIIDYFFGDLLRYPFTCPDAKTHNFTSAEKAQNTEVSKLFNMTNQIECVPTLAPEMYFTFMTFAFLFIMFLLFFVITKVAGPSLKPFAICLFNLTGFVFAMVFLPWFIEEYVVVTPMWLNALILVLSIFLWLGIPPLRDKASLAMIVYLYAYVVKWRVYKTAVLSVEFSDARFNVLMWISGILIWANPFLGVFQRNALGAYQRWRLQKAFYSPESTGVTGCSEVMCQDVLPSCACWEPVAERLNRPLTLDDLVGLSPEYICNVTVNKWRTKPSKREPSFQLLTMAPSGIERIDKEPGKHQFENRLHPADIKLSEAMATSAAAVSYHMGKHEDKFEPLQSIQIMLGLGLGKSQIVEPEHCSRWLSTCLAFLIQLVLVSPIIGLPMIPLLGGSEVWNQRAVICFLVFFCALTLIAIMPTGAEDPQCWQNFVRWCIVHIYHVRFIRELLEVVNVGPTPPAVLHLSDGGHVENLGILPLLKKRLQRIVVIDGGTLKEDQGVAGALINALEKARDTLHCSFIGINGRDVLEDLRANFIDRPSSKQPRSYRFRVEYYNYTEDGEEQKVGEGEVLYILPRHPKQGFSGERKSWGEIAGDVEIDIEADLWGSGPEVEMEEVERLTCCCCECCHRYPLKFLSGLLCGAFPNHSTANQFFTPAMFTAYHREGFRACVEARAVEFLSGSDKNE
ncbi:uncharacterized protein LOC144664342 isoform X2 [Oculina patagonica]